MPLVGVGPTLVRVRPRALSDEEGILTTFSSVGNSLIKPVQLSQSEAVLEFEWVLLRCLRPGRFESRRPRSAGTTHHRLVLL